MVQSCTLVQYQVFLTSCYVGFTYYVLYVFPPGVVLSTHLCWTAVVIVCPGSLLRCWTSDTGCGDTVATWLGLPVPLPQQRCLATAANNSARLQAPIWLPGAQQFVELEASAPWTAAGHSLQLPAGVKTVSSVCVCVSGTTMDRRLHNKSLTQRDCSL